MTIGQLTAETGVSSATIRYWESTGVLPKTPRVSGKRQYSPDTVHRVALVKLAQYCGFSLEEIRRSLHGASTPAEQLVCLQTMQPGRDHLCSNRLPCTGAGGSSVQVEPPARQKRTR